MCTTCGCASGEKTIEGDEHHHPDHHGHHHDHHQHGHHHDDHHHGEQHQQQAGVVIHHHHYYYHQGDVHHHYSGVPEAESFKPEVQPHSQDLHYGRGVAGSHAPGMGQRRLVQIEQDVLSKNNHLAQHNREHFSQQNILVLNLVSSPGSGKTTLLTNTLLQLSGKIPCAVIEGDQQTTNDAERIRATGVPAIQVNTGKGCHLDAQMVHDAAHRLELQDNSLLFIENVGNLVCPASFDLGERHKIAVLSVTEGEDKPLKYPHMFAAASLMIINKIDLLPYVNFSVEKCIAFARQVNPTIQVIQLSASSGEGMDLWLNWLEEQ